MKKLVGLLLFVAGVASGQTITEFSAGISAGASPFDITAGPDGNLWFTEAGGSIGRITPSGVITEFSAGMTAGALPWGITAGPDGNLWFTERNGSRIGQITPAGVITEFSAGMTPGSGPAGITAGPDGNLWFTEPNENRIGQITPAGVITEFSTGLTTVPGPYRITAGADGNLWFTESGGNSVGRITPTTVDSVPAGTITQFAVGAWPFNIAAGADGNLWFTELFGNRIGRIMPVGVITEFSIGMSPGVGPAGITPGPDGNLWFTEDAGNRIGRITPDGAITEFSAGMARGARPLNIVAGPDGNLWFTEYNGNRIGRITPFTFGTPGTPVSPPLAIHALGSMSITVVPNQALLGTGTATVVANQIGTWTATTATPWLSLTLSSGGFPGNVTCTANAAGLAAGSYTGSISVAGTGVGGTQTISISVTLTVNSPAVLTANPASISTASGYPAGSATGYTIQTGAAGLAFTVSTSASSAGWLTVSPTSGIAPTAITVTLDPSKATPGIYTDSIVVSSPGVASVSIPVKMSVSGFITSLAQQVNAATGAGPDHTVAPNEIVSLYLTDFSCAAAPVVSINGTEVGWSSYAPGQINYVVPANISSPAALTVACNGTTAWSFNGLATAAVVPGIFTLTGTGKGQAAVVNSDGTINGSTNPAGLGGWLSVYGTGFGVFTAAGTNGLRTIAGNVTATIGGVDATVLYAGNTPGATDGLQQFNLQIPAGVTAGTAVPIVLTVNGTPTQTAATVAVK